MAGATEEKPIVILITSYNNERWVDRNLRSVFIQKYENYRVIYVDDCSRDATYERALQLVKGNNQQHRFTIIRNEERRNAMANFYTSIHMCKDDEIVVTLDGDDFFAHDEVLARVNEAYNNPTIWFTYGQYMYWPANQIGDVNKTFPQYVIDSNSFRQYWFFPVSHLRTHYAWLFKLIKLEDFLYEDYFYAMTSDKAMLAPMIEMASRGHFLQIHEALLMYNNSNPISDGMVNVKLQTALRDYILGKEPYRPLDTQKSVEFFNQNDHADLIVLCAAKPDYANIDNMLKKLGHLHGAYVLAPADCMTGSCDGTVIHVVYEKTMLVQRLIDLLVSVDSHYIVLGTDSDEVLDNIELTVCLKLLKKTHASLFYFALGYQPEDQQLLNRKRLPRVSQEFPVYAWYSGNKSGEWQIPVMSMTLWQKQLLHEALLSSKSVSVVELQANLDAWLTRENKLGLLSSIKVAR